jgi:ABC-2 type transport system ATP-binding protein
MLFEARTASLTSDAKTENGRVGRGGPMSTAAVVELSDVSVVRGRRSVVRGVSFDLHRGSICGLIGPSGCGKTTVMRSIVGTQRNVSGEIRVLGLRAGSASLRRRVSYTTQQLSAYTDVTVRDNLRYFARILRVRHSQVEHAMRRLRLDPYADRLVRSLSAGQQQRVSLAVALLGEAEVLILDEPTVGLDPALRNELWSLFRELAGAGSTLLISSHVMDEAERCHQLLLMRDGSILASGSPDTLRERTKAATLEQAFLRLVDEQGAPFT